MYQALEALTSTEGYIFPAIAILGIAAAIVVAIGLILFACVSIQGWWERRQSYRAYKQVIAAASKPRFM